VPRTHGPPVYVLASLLLGACSLGEFSLPSSSTPAAPLELPVPDPAATPDQQKLFPAIEQLAKTLKLSGAPEMSRLHRAPTIAPTDWMFCLRGLYNEKPGPYAVFVDKVAIKDYRSAVQIDQCEQDNYEPLSDFAPPPPAPAKKGR
jgi:hypothetical protein